MKSEEAVQLTKRLLFDEIARTHGTDINVLQKLNMGEIWRKFVKNRNDAEAFLEVMYPQFPKQVQLAYVDMFDRAVRGEITLDEKMIHKEGDQAEKWNPMKDLEEERTRGLVNLTQHRLERILREEEEAKDN